MTVRLKRAALVAIVLFTAGCVRHQTVQDFGLKGPAVRQPAPSGNSSLRAIFLQQQIKGALNPVVSDPRIPALEARLAANPADIDARLQLAALYEGYRLHEEALEQYTQAYDRSESEAALFGIVRSDQALNRVWRAIPLLEQFVKETPSAAAWNMLGLLHTGSNDAAAGEIALREAVAAEPLVDRWRNNLGYNLLLQNRIDAAQSEFLKALESNPNSAATHNNLGMLLARRGELDAALEQFQFAADAATAHNNLAVVLMELGKYEQSRDQLVKALAMRRNFAPALSNFKLVQDRMRQRAAIEKMPPGNVRVASANQEASQLKQ
jgi:tetratricopeptide (TPR) repeat protein